MQLRFLEYLIALAEERHFGRAAQRCNVTQPTLSAGIGALEKSLGKQLALRDRRFVGLTAEGQAILPHARNLIAGNDALRREIDAVGPLRGEIKLGAIPATMPFLGRFVRALNSANPTLRIAVRQLTSANIAQGIVDFELDAGLTYLDGDLSGDLLATPLYDERYRFLTRADGPFGRFATVSLAQAVSQPLALLHQGMLNRRILDGHVLRAGLSLAPAATADSYLALISMVRSGEICAIVTDSHEMFVEHDPALRLVAIDGLAHPNRVGLIVPRREPRSPFVRAAVAAAKEATMIDGVD